MQSENQMLLQSLSESLKIKIYLSNDNSFLQERHLIIAVSDFVWKCRLETQFDLAMPFGFSIDWSVASTGFTHLRLAEVDGSQNEVFIP